MACELKEFLVKNDMYPMGDQVEKKRKAISKMTEYIQQWGKKIYIESAGVADDTDVKAATIYVYGSYRLNVYGNNSDIDACIVSNSTITRDDFYDGLYAELLNNPDVKELKQIPSKRSPHLSMIYLNIEFDLNFSRTAYTSLPDNLDILNENILKNMDELDTRAINGVRNTDIIDAFVPNHSEEAFRVMVRTIKLWTKKRGIYGYVYCFLNGISIEILVAQVISENYQLDNVRLLEKFFQVYSSWDWLRTPVMLGTNDDFNDKKKEGIIQILTPASPSENAAFSITKFSLEMIKRELKRGQEIVHEFSSEGVNDWAKLFKPRHLFCGYYIFIEFIVTSSSLEGLTTTIGKFESGLVNLMKGLSEIEEIIEANVIPNGFLDEENERYFYYVGMNVKRDCPVDISTPLNSFLSIVNSGKDLIVDASIKKRSEIPTKFAHAVKRSITKSQEIKETSSQIPSSAITETFDIPTKPSIEQQLKAKEENSIPNEEKKEQLKKEMKQEANTIVKNSSTDDDFMKRFTRKN
ncbi:hypothetical protein ENUP19_0100G0013 [Entamoeba nuttalli]|uniref:polynucleotide adenylyltransferase n=2 Tax=Entamoeba nuttalli TaxID=412467 RepID=K2HQM4_ENTNP|nr:poly(A) polymerase, putative [Entamoeba nuttalli P19]EKE38225.1 poly(A) polymerase, putative [Entamoeba nuttalli P19]|eukprot:XP_008859420.1 poly(A) polymerase, putative [Entamoeba nuttalli P19]